MIKIRSLKEALLYIKSLDNETAISGNAIRMLVVSGKVPSIKVGKKYLVNVDTLVNYFEDRLLVAEACDPAKIAELGEIGEDIKPVPERLKRQKTCN